MCNKSKKIIRPATREGDARLTSFLSSAQAKRGGTVHAQYVTCGKPNCRCQNGERHGPYYFLFWRDGRGRLQKTYLRGVELAVTRAVVGHRQETKAQLREIRDRREASMREWRALLSQFKGLGLGR